MVTKLRVVRIVNKSENQKFGQLSPARYSIQPFLSFVMERLTVLPLSQSSI